MIETFRVRKTNYCSQAKRPRSIFYRTFYTHAAPAALHTGVLTGHPNEVIRGRRVVEGRIFMRGNGVAVPKPAERRRDARCRDAK